MAKSRLKFALFGNEYQVKKSASIQKILSYLKLKRAEIYVDKTFYDFLINNQKIDVEADGVFEGTGMTGKGSYAFAGFPGGSMDITVDMNKNTVRFELLK